MEDVAPSSFVIENAFLDFVYLTSLLLDCFETRDAFVLLLWGIECLSLEITY